MHLIDKDQSLTRGKMLVNVKTVTHCALLERFHEIPLCVKGILLPMKNSCCQIHLVKILAWTFVFPWAYQPAGR